MASIRPALNLLLLVALTLLSLPLCVTADVTTSTATAGNTTESSNVTRCDEELLFQKLYVLMPAINQCAQEADYFVQSSTLAMPSNASLDKFCASANCTKLTAELEDAGLPSCTVQVGTSDLPFKDFFNQIKAHCGVRGSAKKSAAAASASAALGWRLGVTALAALALVLTSVSA